MTSKAEQLSLLAAIEPDEADFLHAAPGKPRPIEQSDFPFERLSSIAEIESWRKEINRPVYHIHKWWAQRLGSVFRAILLGTFAPVGSDIYKLFYSPSRIPGSAVVFDPFMGSGTTVGETLKLGGRAVGRDINPVAWFAVRNALRIPPRQELLATFRAIERDVAPFIRKFYTAKEPGGGNAQVLYYFWVKHVPCPSCSQAVDLFSSYIFAQHAYRTRHPEVRTVCPRCGGLDTVRYDATQTQCGECGFKYDPSSGPAKGSKANCPACGTAFTIGKAVREHGQPPAHRLYAKLVLTAAGEKLYLPADQFDRDLYQEAEHDLSLLKDSFPVVRIEPGYNTNQVLNYCYTHWHQMFNARQLLCLHQLARRVSEIADLKHREIFCCLFSGVLEFNNMFASYKGEGTGAVRHMFSHHILKPERTPLEANLWGTARSSGAFATLFERRILRALEYCSDPFEIRSKEARSRQAGRKIFGLSLPLFAESSATATDFFAKEERLHLSCGDSASTDWPSESVDAVITDPPFFDNVHYSQLADFFYVWQRYILGEDGNYRSLSTRKEAEVQQSDPGEFTDRLSAVWRECHRLLKDDGLLIFTYHHSRREGWECVLASLLNAGFLIVRAHPIKAEMSVATPKQQAREPIDLDMILVCRKTGRPPGSMPALRDLVRDAKLESAAQIRRLHGSGRRLSKNDVQAIFMAQMIARLSRWPEHALEKFAAARSEIEHYLARLHALGGGGDLAASRKASAKAQEAPAI